MLHLKEPGVILDNVASPTYRKQSNNEKKKLKLVVDTDGTKCYDIKVVSETTTTKKIRNAT